MLLCKDKLILLSFEGLGKGDITPGSAQGVLLALSSGITSGSAREINQVPGVKQGKAGILSSTTSLTRNNEFLRAT